MAHAQPTPRPTDDGAATAFEALGFELGREHARFGLVPPAAHLGAESPVRQGWQAGRRAFGRRVRTAAPGTAAWLALRLQAWTEGVAVDTLTVTPNHVAQLATTHCPVTRRALHRPAAGRVVRVGATATHPDSPVLVRLAPTAGYAAGHLAELSQSAAAAQQGLSLADLCEALRQLQQPEALGARGGTVNAVQASRLVVLRSFVTPLPHAQAAALPLLVLPPNRLRLLNPIQGLQVLVTLLLLRSGWSKQLPQLEALLPHAAARRELRQFFLTLLPRAIAGGRPGDRQARRWALEDAWRHPAVLAAWKRFALLLDAEATDTLLQRAVQAGLLAQPALLHTPEQATEGWFDTPAEPLTRHAAEGHGTPARRPGWAAGQPARALPARHAAAPHQLALPI